MSVQYSTGAVHTAAAGVMDNLKALLADEALVGVARAAEHALGDGALLDFLHI